MTESEKVDIAVKALERLVKSPHVVGLIEDTVQRWIDHNAKRMVELVINQELIEGSIRSVARKASDRVERRLTALMKEAR